MHTELITFSGLALMFVLGMRHGLDPDHIACIDGLTWRAINLQHPHSRWIGTLFALGHGLLVTAIAVAVSQLTKTVEIPSTIVSVFGWIPTALLILVGALNLRFLLRPNSAYAPVGWKFNVIPKRWRDQTSPWSVIAVGVLFATVFDTTTQVSAWAYVASSKGGAMAALLAGLLFTAGMVITDTIDGRLICRAGQGALGAVSGDRYRRTLGWVIVCMSFGVAAYNLALIWLPGIELGDLAFMLAGATLVLVTAVFWLWAVFGRRNPQNIADEASPGAVVS